MAGDLLGPTLQDHKPRPRGAPLPWRLGSQVYVAVFGGALAVTAIAFLNAIRLGMPDRSRWAILAAGAVGLAATVVYAFAITDPGEPVPDGARLGTQLIGVAAYGVMFVIQRPWDRIHQAFGPGEEDDESYESLWGPGLLAVVVGALIVFSILEVASS